MSRVCHRLSRDQFFKLCEYLKSQKSSLEKTPANRIQLARLTTIALGYEISAHHAREAAKIVGIPLQSLQGHVAGNSSSAQKVRARKCLIALSLGFLQLLDRLGEKENIPVEILEPIQDFLQHKFAGKVVG